jgi:2-deoxy-D-gluconate 3-dehydrogenase
MTLFDLSGRVAVITGGNGGIGLGIARGLAEAGASVVIAGRNKTKNTQALQQIEDLGARAMAVAVDVTNEASCHSMIASVVQRFGRMDILVNNAGINIRKRPEQYGLAEWRLILESNLTSAFVCSQAAYPEMQRQGGGKIINIGSMMSIFGASFAVAYGASKGGIVQMTRGLAVAWAADNIQVNAILPGWITTDLSKEGRSTNPALYDTILARTPARRWGSPDDHAGIAVFLASRASDFVTGTAIPLDGGYSVQG